jgi:uncharacterized protein DUF4440
MSDTIQELTDLNREMGRAENERDTQFLAEHLAEGLVFRRGDGSVIDKKTYLAGLASPENTYEFIHIEDVEVLGYGEDTALVSLRIWAKGRRSGKDFEGIYRNTRLFLRLGDKWQCALWFNTPSEGFPT